MNLYGKLDELSKLVENWDGYNAEPLDPEIMAVAREIASAMPEEMSETAQPVPGSNGSVQFEWHDEGQSLEIVVGPSREITYLKSPKDSNEETWEEGETTVDGVGKLFEWWMEGSSA